MFARTENISLLEALRTSTPLKRILPDFGGINLRIDLATVDLPQPDSPTSESVCELSIPKLTSSTAGKICVVFPKIPEVMLK